MKFLTGIKREKRLRLDCRGTFGIFKTKRITGKGERAQERVELQLGQVQTIVQLIVLVDMGVV